MATVTRLYDSYADARPAVEQLRGIGISEDDISVVSHNRDAHHVEHDNDAGAGAGTGAGLGAVVGGAGGLLTGLGIMAIPGVGPVVAAGWLAATAAGAVAGAVVGGAAGGLIGALTDSGVSEDDAHVYAEGVRRGGTLLTARVSDAQHDEAQAILNGVDHVDLAQRRTIYTESGWTGFDENAKPYTDEEIEEERRRNNTPGTVPGTPFI